MIIPPEKVIALLNGSAGGGPRGEAGPLMLTRREIASGLQVRDNDAFRELIRSMTAAGYLRRVHEQGRGWCYMIGRPLDARMRADDPPPGIREEEYRRARDDLARLRQQPRGTRPNIDPTGGKIVHGVEMRPAALCGRDVTNLRTDIPLLPGADLDLLDQRETCTMLLEDITCPACIAVRDRPVSGAGAGPVGRRPGQIVTGAPEPFDATAEDVVHGANRADLTLCFVPLAGMPEFDITVAHGCPSYTRDLALMTCAACLRVGDDPQVHGQLPGVPEFTACGEVADNLHNPGDRIVDASLRWPEEGATITCTPCRMALDLFAADDERRRQGDAAAAAGEIVHLLVGGRAGNGSSCRIERTQQPPTLPEGHSLTVYPAGMTCAVCIDLNGGHRGANDGGFNEGRAAADGPVDTSQRPPNNFVQGLAAARAEAFARWVAAARAQYNGRCTFAGAFNSEHPYEHDVETVARSMADNGGYDEWERCSKTRDDALHLGDGDAAWLAELFEFEACHECGQGADRHRVAVSPTGNRFAECVDEAGTPMAGSPDAVSIEHDDRCTFNRLELGGRHAFTTARPPEGQEGWDICEQPRNAPVHQVVEGSRAGLDDWTPGDFGPELDRPLAGDATPVDGPCMVSEQEIGTPHSGQVRPYRATDSTGRWLVCDGHIAGARERLAELGHSAGLVGVDVADDEQAAHDAEFFRRLFAERPCLVCGAGPEGHRVERRDEGHSVPVCINPPADSPVRADQMAGPCTFYGHGFDGPHVFVFDDESRPEHLDPAVTCGQPRSASVHVERGEHVTSTGPAELESLDINAHELRPAAAEEGFADYRRGRRDYANEQVDETEYWSNGDYAQGVRDEYVIVQRAENTANQAPEGWTPPEPRWTARTFAGEPVDFPDQAEEAWRHRVERIDHWRRQGRISDREATALLAPMSPGAVIDEEQAWRRNGTAARFDPAYADEVERLSLDADNGHGTCRYCGESLGHEHAFVTGPDGRPVMEHAPWDYTEGHGTRYDAPGIAAAANLVPGDPVMSGGRHGIFEYLTDDGLQAFVTFEGQSSPEQVPAGSVHPHGGSR